MSVFGFSTETSSGDFTPIVKYDARAGLLFRMDRIQASDGSFSSEPVEITDIFKALADFENIEVGWIDFSTGSAPSFVLVPRGKMLPERPSANHKQGIRFLLKLARECGGDKPIREIAGTSKAFLSAAEKVVAQYDAEKAAHPGQLPVIMFDGKAVPVKTGTGNKSSTNYHPKFKIVGWAPRGDLVPQPRGTTANVTPANVTSGNGAAPATGAQRAAPPNLAAAATRQNVPDDFSSDFG
jgi:hypothetical protein